MLRHTGPPPYPNNKSHSCHDNYYNYVVSVHFAFFFFASLILTLLLNTQYPHLLFSHVSVFLSSLLTRKSSFLMTTKTTTKTKQNWNLHLSTTLTAILFPILFYLNFDWHFSCSALLYKHKKVSHSISFRWQSSSCSTFLVKSETTWECHHRSLHFLLLFAFIMLYLNCYIRKLTHI